MSLHGGDLLVHLGAVQAGISGEDLGKDTSNVGAGHRSARDGVVSIDTTNPSGCDGCSRGEDIDALPHGLHLSSRMTTLYLANV